MLTSSNASARLTINNVTESFVVKDLTDYVSIGVAPADVTIFLKIAISTSEGTTTLYDNITTPGSPDINRAVTDETTASIPIEQDGDGRPVQGTYTLTALYVVNGAPTYNVTYIATHELSFEYPSISIGTEINCSASTLKATDDTDYNGGSIVSRTFTIYPPAGAKYADGTDAVKKTTSLNVNVYGPNFFTGLYNVSIESDVQWDLSNTFTLIDNLEGSVSPNAVCDTNLCDLLCCVSKVNDEYMALSKTNMTRAKQMEVNVIDPMMREFCLALGAMQCGNAVLLAEARDNVLEISGCESCSCTSDKPVMIIPIQSSNSEFTVTSNNNTISIVTTVNGSLTTFDLSVSSAIINVLNSLRNTYLQSSDINIVPTTNPDGSITYTLSLGANANKNPIINLWLRIENLGAGWIVTATPNQLVGDNVVTPGDITYILGDKTPGNPTSADVVYLVVKDFFTSLQTYTCSANIMKSNFTTPAANIATTANVAQLIKAEIFYSNQDTPTSNVVIRVVRPDGTPFLFADMPLLGATLDQQKIDINLLITPQN